MTCICHHLNFQRNFLLACEISHHVREAMSFSLVFICHVAQLDMSTKPLTVAFCVIVKAFLQVKWCCLSPTIILHDCNFFAPPMHTHVYSQAIGDPGQGWGNAILYVFMSPAVRNQLIIMPLRKLIRKTGKALLAVGGDSSIGEDEEEDSNVQEGNQNQGGARVIDAPRFGRRRGRSRLSENTLTSEVLDECEPTPCASPGPPTPGFHQPISQPPIEEMTESTTDTAASTRLPV